LCRKKDGLTERILGIFLSIEGGKNQGAKLSLPAFPRLAAAGGALVGFAVFLPLGQRQVAKTHISAG
jgi:hypothetical protein